MRGGAAAAAAGRGGDEAAPEVTPGKGGAAAAAPGEGEIAGAAARGEGERSWEREIEGGAALGGFNPKLHIPWWACSDGLQPKNPSWAGMASLGISFFI